MKKKEEGIVHEKWTSLFYCLKKKHTTMQNPCYILND